MARQNITTYLKPDRLLVYGLYAWLWLLPWQTRYFYEAVWRGFPWEGLSLSIYATEALLVLLLILNFFKWTRVRKISASSGFGWGARWPIIFAILVFLSAGWSVLPALTVYASLKIILGLGVWWLVRSNEISFRRVAAVFVSAGVLQGLLAVYQFVNQYVPGSSWLGMAVQDPQQLGVAVVETELRRWLRAHGSFPHPNILGGYLVIVMAYSLYLIEFVETQWRSVANRRLQLLQGAVLASVPIIASGIVLSFSRAAWLALGLLLGSYALFHILKRPVVGLKTIGMVGLLTVLTAGMWLAVYREPFVTRLTGSERLELMSTEQRLSAFGDAFDLFGQRPLLGTGAGAYTYALHERFVERYPWQLQPPHNVFIMVLVELGAVGLVLFLAWLLWVVPRTRRPWWQCLFIALFCLWCFDHWWWSLATGQYLSWFLLGLLYREEKL